MAAHLSSKQKVAGSIPVVTCSFLFFPPKVDMDGIVNIFLLAVSKQYTAVFPALFNEYCHIHFTDHYKLNFNFFQIKHYLCM
jgi:hypothetical protein